jgi:pimeloyl-ACP methyl ester carboxylesterase
MPAFREAGLGVLTPNLRLNSWMSPAAAADLHGLLRHAREAFGARRFLFASGSMGGSSNLIYACLHPQDVAGMIALGFVSDLTTFHPFCRRRNTPLGTEVADAIEAAYGGAPSQRAEVYKAHSAQAHAERLTMPTYLSHGTLDEAIPVSQARLLVARLPEAANLAYVEIPGGNHDSPLWKMGEALRWVLETMGRSL